MEMVNYNKAKRYSTKCGYPELDYVHDAFIKYWDKTGKNLFDQGEHLVMRVIKQVMINGFNKQHKLMKDGEVAYRHFVGLESVETTYDAPQYSIVAYNEGVRKAEQLGGTIGTVYRHLSRGFTPQEIQEIEGIPDYLVRYYRQRLKLLVN